MDANPIMRRWLLCAALGALALAVGLVFAWPAGSPAAALNAIDSNAQHAVPLPASLPATVPYDTLVDAQSSVPETLDPHWLYDAASMRVTAQVYETLLTYERQDPAALVPQLATGWQVSGDGKTFTLDIRTGVTFHAGGTLEAHDVAYSFWRGLIQSRDDGPMWMWYDVLFEGASSIEELPGNDAAKCQAVKDAVTYDDAQGTVTFHLPNAFAPLLNLMAGPSGSILDQEWMAANGGWGGSCTDWRTYHNPAAGDSTLYDQMNGTGPFRFGHWTAGEIKLVRTEGYWRDTPAWPEGPSGPAALYTVLLQYVSDWPTRRDMLVNGEADLADVPVENSAELDPWIWEVYDGPEDEDPTLMSPTGTLRLFQNLPTMSQTPAQFNYDINPAANPYIGSGALDGNGIPTDFFADLHVRKAFNYAMDWPALIAEIFGGKALQAKGPIPSGELGYNSAQATYFYSPTLSTQEFQLAWGGAAWSQGFSLTIPYRTDSATSQRAAEILAQNVEALSPTLQVNVIGMSKPDLVAARNAKLLPVYIAGWAEDYHHPHNWVHAFLHSQGFYAGVQNFPPALAVPFDAKIDECVRLTDLPAAQTCYEELQNLSYVNAAAAWGYQRVGRHYERTEVRGTYFSPASGDVPYYYALSKWASDVALTLSDDPDPVVVGEALAYTIAVANKGPLDATGVIVTDTLPGSVTFASAPAGCTREGRTVTCDLGPLAAGQVATVTIHVTADATGQLINLAQVAANELDSDPTNNSQVEYTAVSAAPVLGPVPSDITPTSGVNNVLTPISIGGANFQDGATVSLGGTPLQSVSFVSAQRLQAVVPSGLTPGTHRLTVANPDGRSGELPHAFTVLTPDPPALASVKPSQGPNDMPVTLEIQGYNLSPDVEVTLSLGEEQVPLVGLVFLDTTRLLADVPISTTLGLYDVTLTNPDDQSDLLADAYRVLEPAANNDLYADETDLWLDPPGIHEWEATTIGLTLRRQGGQADLQDVVVRFFLEGGVPVFTATAALLPPRSFVTVTVDWAPPPVQGDYTLYAEIDPLDIIPENNEGNNLISRTVTVLPPVSDTTPPTVDSLTIDDGALYNPRQYVYLDVKASDNPGGSGVAYLLFVEYLFVQSEGDWVPVSMSNWLPHDEWYKRGWALSIQPGAHYFQVWAADAAGNISLLPASKLINWNPPVTPLVPGAVRVYRHPWVRGERLWIEVSDSGTSLAVFHFHVFDPVGHYQCGGYAGPGYRPAAICVETNTRSGVYQFDVWCWRHGPGPLCSYKLQVAPLGSTSSQATGGRFFTQEDGPEPVIPPSYAPGRHIGLPSPPYPRTYFYLPIVVRQAQALTLADRHRLPAFRPEFPQRHLWEWTTVTENR